MARPKGSLYILHYTQPGDIVFDGFAGTGMTGVAAGMCGNPDAQTKQKIEAEQFAVSFEKEQLNNKIESQKAEIVSLKKQEDIISDLVQDNSTLLNSEERLFEMGESSLFLINTRENNLVLAQLSKILIENRFYISNADLYKTVANPN
jgi:outer membrane protein TolC